MAFTQKLINVTFTSGSGGFSPLNLTGLRVTCHTIAGAGDSMIECDILIYGMTLSHMNKLAYPYLPGTARTQMAQLAKHANINWTIDRETLAIWPSDGNRNGASPLISPHTGMVGYPSMSSVGIKLKTLFNNELRIGGQVQVQSSVTTANGTWTI